MGAFLVKRILATIPVLVIVAVIVFTLIRLVPGDPAAVIAGNMATNEDIARIRRHISGGGKPLRQGSRLVAQAQIDEQRELHPPGIWLVLRTPYREFP